MPTASSALGGARRKSTLRANTPTRFRGLANRGWWRKFKIDRGCSCTLRGHWRRPLRHFVSDGAYDGGAAAAGARRGRRDGVEAAVAQTFRRRYRAREPWGLPREPLAVTRRAQAPRVPRQVPAARQDLRVRERRRPQVDDNDPVDFRTHERKTKTHSEVYNW